MNLEEERDTLRKEIAVKDQLIGLILQAVGRDVLVTNEQIKAGLPNKRIVAEDRLDLNGVVFFVEDMDA